MQVEVDFEVFKALTARRDTEETTYNEVLRQLLDLPVRKLVEHSPSPASQKSLIANGVEFPHDTEFHMRYKGRLYDARVCDGYLVYKGKLYSAVSAPACEIARTSVNGWKYWECRFPGHTDWQSIDTLRHRARSNV